MPYRFIAFSHEDAFRFTHASLKLMIERLDTDGDADEKVEFAKEQVLVILQALAHVHGGFANLMVPAVVAAIKKNHSSRAAEETAPTTSDEAAPSAEAENNKEMLDRSSRSTKRGRQVMIEEFLRSQLRDTNVDGDVLRLSDTYNAFSEWWATHNNGNKAPNSKELRETMDAKLRKKSADGWHGYKIGDNSEINNE